MINNSGGIEVFDDPLWMDCVGALDKINSASEKFTKGYLKKNCGYETLEEYAGKYLIRSNSFTKLARIAECVFIEMLEDDPESCLESDAFDVYQIDAANSGFVIGLRVGEIAFKKQRNFYLDAVRIKLQHLTESDSQDLSSVNLLTSQSNNFVAKYTQITPNIDHTGREAENVNFARAYAYQLGYLIPISTAFDILVDPTTYFDFVVDFVDDSSQPSKEILVDLLDIAVLPTTE